MRRHPIQLIRARARAAPAAGLRRAFALVAGLALFAAACGQLDDPHPHPRAVDQAPASQQTTGETPGDPAAAPPPQGGQEPGQPPDTRRQPQPGGSAPDGGQEPREPADGEPADAEQQDPAQQSAQQPDEQRQARGTDRTGVTDDTIRLGTHAPVTGAAPLPTDTFEEAADLYWRWIIEEQGQTVLGRTNIELEFRDDRYQPSTAIQVCREMAQEVFALAGAGGTDQIQACARYADNAQVPYSSAGVTEEGLADLDWYTAFSMTYRAQGELLAQYVRANFADQRVGAIITDTPNFDDAARGWEQGVEREGLNYHRTYRHPRGDTTWYNTAAREFQQEGVEVVYINTSPVDYIRFAQQANQQGFRPQYVGVGITMGLNPVLEGGCPDVDGGIFFSPFPGLDYARENVPEFFQAAERFGAPADDIAFAIWGQSKATHEVFEGYGEAYGDDLTREDYRDFVRSGSFSGGGIFPPTQFTEEDPFGAGQVHVLRGNCDTEEYETLHTFSDGF